MISKGTQEVFTNIFILILVGLAFTSAFMGGFYSSQLLTKFPESQTQPPSIIPTKPPDSGPETPQNTTRFESGKKFYDEGFYVQVKAKPEIVLLMSVTRKEETNSTYTQSTRVSYFNGDTTIRQVYSQTSSDSAILSNKYIKSWTTTIDPSRVLRENSEIGLSLNGKDMRLSTGELTNELPIRSLPGYTKFFSNGNGALTLDGISYPAHVLFYRLYSQNAADLEFYTQPIGLTTDLVVFWDAQDNLYLIDKSEVTNPIDSYQTHQIGFQETSGGSVSKTFAILSKRDGSSPPNTYSIDLGSPVNTNLELTRLKSINKAPGDSYSWFLSTVSGFVNINGQRISGSGIVEYIHDLK